MIFNMDELKVLYEDNHLIAVMKPAGVPVEPGGGSKPLTEYVRDYLREKYDKPGNIFIGIVHRLDQPVSGVLVFAKTSKGASRLSEQFRAGEVGKIYHALVAGEINKSGEFSGFIEKDSRTRKARLTDVGKEARLKYEVVVSGSGKTLLRINLGTGRFHQIRAILASLGHPIEGDVKYGSRKRFPGGEIALRARELSFKKAAADEVVSITAPEAWWEKEFIDELKKEL